MYENLKYNISKEFNNQYLDLKPFQAIRHLHKKRLKLLNLNL